MWQTLMNDFRGLHEKKNCAFPLTLLRMGEGGGRQKGPLTSFSPVTSTNVGVSPKNCLTFSYNPFATLV